jgi:hypothetical protein
MTDQELEALLAAERAHDDLPTDVEERILARTLSAIGGGGSGGPTDGGPSSPAGSPAPAPPPAAGTPFLAKLGYVVLGTAIGAGGHAALSRPDAPARGTNVETPSVVVVSSGPVSIASEPSASAGPSSDTPDADHAKAKTESAPSPRPAVGKGTASMVAPTPPIGDDAAERTDLDVARAALARGRADACLAALAEHRRTYGEGSFAEERESLWIQALAAAGRLDEARARLAKFRARYPGSLFAPALDKALTSTEAP